MKSTIRISVAAVLFGSMLAIAAACKKSSEGDCKTCKAKERVSHETVGMEEVCTQEEENAFRSKFEGTDITCQ